MANDKREENERKDKSHNNNRYYDCYSTAIIRWFGDSVTVCTVCVCVRTFDPGLSSIYANAAPDWISGMLSVLALNGHHAHTDTN